MKGGRQEWIEKKIEVGRAATRGREDSEGNPGREGEGKKGGRVECISRRSVVSEEE